MTPRIGHHVWSLLLPPIRTTGLWPGARPRNSATSTGLMWPGSRPVYRCVALYSKDTPRNAGGIAWPYGVALTSTGRGGASASAAGALRASAHSVRTMTRDQPAGLATFPWRPTRLLTPLMVAHGQAARVTSGTDWYRARPPKASSFKDGPGWAASKS